MWGSIVLRAVNGMTNYNELAFVFLLIISIIKYGPVAAALRNVYVRARNLFATARRVHSFHLACKSQVSDALALRIVLLFEKWGLWCASAPSDRRSLFSFYYIIHMIYAMAASGCCTKDRIHSIRCTIFNAVTLSLLFFVLCCLGLCWLVLLLSISLFAATDRRRLSSSLRFCFVFIVALHSMWLGCGGRLRSRRRRLLLFLTFNDHELITRTIMRASASAPERARALLIASTFTWIFVAWFTIMKNYFTHIHHTREHTGTISADGTIAFEPTSSLYSMARWSISPHPSSALQRKSIEKKNYLFCVRSITVAQRLSWHSTIFCPIFHLDCDESVATNCCNCRIITAWH